MDPRYERAVSAIDAANADDPATIVVDDEPRRKELAHAEMAEAWVRRLRPDASEALLLAARGHHIRRWTIPRRDYPEGRAGYLRWKRDLQAFHARELGAILTACGYDDMLVERVQAIVRKQGLATDDEVRTFEDALCLVFLETQLHDLAAKAERDVVVNAIRKSLAKMSDDGRAAALGLLDHLPVSDRTLVEEALQP